MKGDFPENVPYGYCRCGCGEKTRLSTDKGLGERKPIKYILGHHVRSGNNAPGWKGGRIIFKQKHTSYVRVHMPDHPRSNNKGYVLEHILVVEKKTHRLLPMGAVVHHIDGNGLNNDVNNLQIFSSSSEHMHFHKWIRRQNKYNKMKPRKF